MPRISAITNEEATPSALESLNQVQSKLGMVPNTLRTLAQSPNSLAGFLALQGAIHQGVLSASEREEIALASAQYNSCLYCLSAHTLLGKRAGLQPEQLAASRRGEGSAFAKLAYRILETKGQLSDDDLRSARESGLDDRRIVETIVVIAENVLTNFLNNVAEVEIDFPRVDLS